MKYLTLYLSPLRREVNSSFVLFCFVLFCFFFDLQKIPFTPKNSYVYSLLQMIIHRYLLCPIFVHLHAASL